MKPDNYASYLVRLWLKDHDEKGENQLHVEIESIQTGQKWACSDLQVLQDFLRAQIGVEALDPAGPPNDCENDSGGG